MTVAYARWPAAFAFTELVEVPLYCLIARLGVVRAVLPSLLTHPALWFLYWPIARDALGLEPLPATIAGEVLVVAAEAALVMRWCSPRRAMVASLVANASSALLGEASRALFGIP